MFRTTHRSLAAAAGGLALLAMLAACSTPSSGRGADGDPQLATLETGAPSSTESADPLFTEYGEPVRLRLDMTDEEELAAWQPRDRCVADRTSPPQSGQLSGGGSSGAAVGDPEKAAEAEATCVRLAPLPPWELDVKNPDAQQFAQRIVDCLREHGVREVEIGEGDAFGRIGIELGGESNDSTSISLGMQHGETCEAAASEGGTP
ncbi:hypothetical protein [Microbacterium sp. LWH13-1.2]|uniref:hypothetical protein n=1 Tax=Microbacterium sp. LWH13-1.2 TaxID=3135260 RepID=UPI00313A1839